METLKTGVVGCGKVGHLHAKALSRMPESRFVAACDFDFQRAQQFAAGYKVQAYRECAEHVRQLEGESPFDNLMEVKS
jgi:predicted dehydrogenase